MKTFEDVCSFCGAPVIRKTRKNRYFCNIGCKAEWQRLQKPATKEWLYQKYIVERLDCTKIAHLVGRDPKRVWEWLIDYKIQTRPRGENHYFKNGMESPFKGRTHTKEVKDAIRAQRLKDGRIPAFINGVHWMKFYGRKPATWKGGITPERQALYASDEWKAVVVRVWHAANAKCVRCGRDSRSVQENDRRFCIHHIEAFSIKHRRADVTNLVLLCRPCHLWIHSKKNVNREYLGAGH